MAVHAPSMVGPFGIIEDEILVEHTLHFLGHIEPGPILDLKKHEAIPLLNSRHGHSIMPQPLPASSDSSPPQPSGPAVQDNGMAIAKNCTPIAPLASTLHAGFKIGILQGQVRDATDFLEPMAADDLDRWEGGA